MRLKEFFCCLPENAVFWLFLFFMAFGSAASLYGKITDRNAARAVYTEYYAAEPVVSVPSAISIKDYISSEPFYPCRIYRTNISLR